MKGRLTAVSAFKTGDWKNILTLNWTHYALGFTLKRKFVCETFCPFSQVFQLIASPLNIWKSDFFFFSNLFNLFFLCSQQKSSSIILLQWKITVLPLNHVEKMDSFTFSGLLSNWSTVLFWPIVPWDPVGNFPGQLASAKNIITIIIKKKSCLFVGLDFCKI